MDLWKLICFEMFRVHPGSRSICVPQLQLHHWNKSQPGRIVMNYIYIYIERDIYREPLLLRPGWYTILSMMIRSTLVTSTQQWCRNLHRTSVQQFRRPPGTRRSIRQCPQCVSLARLVFLFRSVPGFVRRFDLVRPCGSFRWRNRSRGTHINYKLESPSSLIYNIN